MRLLLPVLLLCVPPVTVWWTLSHTALFHDAPPRIEKVTPGSGEFGVSVSSPLVVTFNKALRPETITSSTILLSNPDHAPVSTTVNYHPAAHQAIVMPKAPLAYSAQYTITVFGGQSGTMDTLGTTLSNNIHWSFITGAPPPPAPTEGPGGPILIIAGSSNPFSRYYAEILRAEGLNEFDVADISRLTTTLLNKHDVVIVGELPLHRNHVTMLMDWVRKGGSLIAMRPEPKLAAAIGLRSAPTTLNDSYVSINTSISPGRGLADETIQFHGPADLYHKTDATVVATLYSSATDPTNSPAIVLKHVAEGWAAAFTYDLARSVIYTRQGNPSWNGTERDGITPIRSDDLFYGPAASDPQPDWIDFRKIRIPQADEQQRLLANLMLHMTYSRKPLPRFWYFPRGFKAVVIMTGDDHGHGGTVGRFKHFLAQDPPNCSLIRWECVRSTSNIYVGSINAGDAIAATRNGFEIGLHVFTKCKDWPSETIQQEGKLVKRVERDAINTVYSRQLALFQVAYPRIPAPVTNRVDCVTWGDYDTQPQVELSHGIRLDTNYYYWPSKWVRNRPGMFTGSGMPMRFARLDGTIIDVYQAATQMTDESGQTYPSTINALLSNALGPNEYYGAFTANMHTDRVESSEADAVVAAAKARGVPIITAGQMLAWLDGRNGSSFQNLRWNGNTLKFTVSVGIGGYGIETMLPMNSSAGQLDALWANDQPLAYVKRSVAGIDYAEFPSPPGNYRAAYAPQEPAAR